MSDILQIGIGIMLVEGRHHYFVMLPVEGEFQARPPRVHLRLLARWNLRPAAPLPADCVGLQGAISLAFFPAERSSIDRRVIGLSIHSDHGNESRSRHDDRAS